MSERRGDHENKTVLVPNRFSSIPIAWFLQPDRNTDSHINQFKPTVDVFLSLIHTALKLEGGIHLMIATQVYGSLDKMHCNAYQVPYTCLLVFYDGQKEIDQDIEDVDEHGGSYEDQNTGILHHKCSHLRKTLYIILPKRRSGLHMWQHWYPRTQPGWKGHIPCHQICCWTTWAAINLDDFRP